jgi:hypothetical protein
MKYICLGYIEPVKFEEMIEDCDERTQHVQAPKTNIYKRTP